jgi:hypothetical protein
LTCGHQERAVFKAMGLLGAAETPVRLEALRRSPYTGRATDVSCVLDIMIHDLDLALALNPTEPVKVSAEGRIQYGPHFDEVSTEIVFADGMVAAFNACRTDEGRTRTMGVDYPFGPLRIDFMTRAFENGTGLPLNAGFADTPEGKDPLGASVAAFPDGTWDKSKLPSRHVTEGPSARRTAPTITPWAWARGRFTSPSWAWPLLERGGALQHRPDAPGPRGQRRGEEGRRHAARVLHHHRHRRHRHGP